MRELICAALSALLFYFSQGLADAWLLTWIAPAPLLWLAFGDTPAWRLVLASLVAFLAGQIWILQCYGDAPPMALAVLFGLRPILFPFAILFARLVLRGCGPLAAVLAFPACWTAMDYVASWLSPHATLGAIAYSEISSPVVVQSASLFGMCIVTFVLCLFASSMALLVRGGRRALVAAGAGVALCAVDLTYGAERLRVSHPREVLRVAAAADAGLSLQVNKVDAVGADVNASSMFASTLRALAGQGAKLIVTPEESLATSRGSRARVLASLASVSKQTGTGIVAGVLERAPLRDTAVVFEPDGRSFVYSKRHLLPPIENNFIPGASSGLLGHDRAVEICKDMDFPESVRQDARLGLTVMAVPAWDFGADRWMHARIAIMRGVENGFSLVRAANNGLLTATDAEGRVIAEKRVSSDHMDTMLADLPLGTGPTLYAQIGDIFSWVCMALTLLLGIVALSNRRPGDIDARASVD